MATSITFGEALQALLTTVFSVGGAGYLLHAFWSDYKEMKTELRTKVAKSECKEWRDSEAETLKQHKENDHG
jgi:hypothetical protein